jgi:hypothetical protein
MLCMLLCMTSRFPGLTEAPALLELLVSGKQEPVELGRSNRE